MPDAGTIFLRASCRHSQFISMRSDRNLQQRRTALFDGPQTTLQRCRKVRRVLHGFTVRTESGGNVAEAAHRTGKPRLELSGIRGNAVRVH